MDFLLPLELHFAWTLATISLLKLLSLSPQCDRTLSSTKGSFTLCDGNDNVIVEPVYAVTNGNSNGKGVIINVIINAIKWGWSHRDQQQQQCQPINMYYKLFFPLLLPSPNGSTTHSMTTPLLLPLPSATMWTAPIHEVPFSVAVAATVWTNLKSCRNKKSVIAPGPWKTIKTTWHPNDFI